MSTQKNVVAKTTIQEANQPAKIASIPVIRPFTNGEAPPLDERLHRLNVLFDLQKKYNGLKDSLLKLKSFKLGHNHETAYLTFRDEERNDFTTRNTEVMQEFLDFLQSVIERKIKEIEPKLIW